MEHFAHSASKKLAAAGREIRYFEYRLKKKAQQQKHQNGKTGSSSSSKHRTAQPGTILEFPILFLI